MSLRPWNASSAIAWKRIRPNVSSLLATSPSISRHSLRFPPPAPVPRCGPCRKSCVSPLAGAASRRLPFAGLVGRCIRTGAPRHATDESHFSSGYIPSQYDLGSALRARWPNHHLRRGVGRPAARSLHIALRQLRLAPSWPARLTGACRFRKRRAGRVAASRGQQRLCAVRHLSPCSACRRRSARSVGRSGMGCTGRPMASPSP